MPPEIQGEREVRVFCPEFRASVVDGVKRIGGYAAVFNKWSDDLGWFREKIAPGAFANAITKGDTVALFNHNPDIVLGRRSSGTLRLSEDAHGLLMEVDLPDTQAANDLYTLVERGDIKQQSFGFIVKISEWQRGKDGEPDERTITEVRELFDVSPVTFSAYPDTTVAKRSLDITKSHRDAEATVDVCHENDDIDIQFLLNRYEV